MRKGSALFNEIKPALPAWCIPTANVLNQKEKEKKKKGSYKFSDGLFSGG